MIYKENLYNDVFINVIDKDVLEISSGVICHSVNCQGKFNKGLAKKIREKYPNVYEEYMDLCKKVVVPRYRLDLIQRVNVSDSLTVVNLFTQLYYGDSTKTGVDYNSYDAWTTILTRRLKIFENETLYFPYKIGCGLAGGNWNLIASLISYNYPNAVFCKMV